MTIIIQVINMPYVSMEKAVFFIVFTSNKYAGHLWKV